MKLNCLITDDEPIAQEIIERYVNMLPDFNLVAKCNNAIETYSALRNHKIDLLFIDVQMPEINGLDLIRSLKKPPFIIFTTAHPAFAVDGFELDAVDYLLKPISLNRFLKAIEKVHARLNYTQEIIDFGEGGKNQKREYFFVKSGSEMTRIDFRSILYIESLENYVKIVCDTRSVIVHYTMKTVEGVLPQENFLRIHRSFIVNMNKVDTIKDYFFNIKNVSLQTGKSYKKSVQKILKEKYSILIGE